MNVLMQPQAHNRPSAAARSIPRGRGAGVAQARRGRASSTRVHVPLDMFHTRTLQSSDALYSVTPSAAIFSASTPPSCPERTCSVLYVCAHSTCKRRAGNGRDG